MFWYIMKTPLWFYELNCIKLLLYKWLPNWMKKKVVAPSNLSLVDLHLCQKNKCIIFVSYICIVAFHLGTIEEPREWRDDGVEPEDRECGHIQKMDGWIPMCTTEGRCSPSTYPLTNTDLVLFPGKPRSMSYLF